MYLFIKIRIHIYEAFKAESHFTVNNNLQPLPRVCENDMKSKFTGVQSLCCTWDHVGYDHGCHVSQNCCIIVKRKKNMLTDELYKCVQSISISE